MQQPAVLFCVCVCVDLMIGLVDRSNKKVARMNVRLLIFFLPNCQFNGRRLVCHGMASRIRRWLAFSPLFSLDQNRQPQLQSFPSKKMRRASKYQTSSFVRKGWRLASCVAQFYLGDVQEKPGQQENSCLSVCLKYQRTDSEGDLPGHSPSHQRNLLFPGAFG
jgi:hypothetical protein